MLAIVEFNMVRHADAFRDINVEWIDTYFDVEAQDLKALDNPQEYILDRGGAILIAEWDGEPVGTCALIPFEQASYQFELAKMGVRPAFHGKGIGQALAEQTLVKAKELGAKGVYLESNSKLKSALRLYQRMGFEHIEGIESPYCRCDVQMGIRL